MYRRLKNLLGVSLIILAIVLSQLPMGAVQADTISQGGTEVSDEENDTGENSGTKAANEESNEAAKSTGNEENRESAKNAVGEENDEENNAATEAADIAAFSSARAVTGTATPAASTVTYTVTFDYGFPSSAASTEPASASVADGYTLGDNIDWKINGNALVVGTDYTIGTKTYTFTGWYKDPDCNDKWAESDSVGKDMTLYADWKCKDDSTWTITYSATTADSASEQTQKKQIPAGKRLIVDKPTEPFRSGYRFVNWTYENTDTEIRWGEIPTAAMTFTAKWENRKYTVTFHANGGVFTTNGQETYTKEIDRGTQIQESDYPEINTVYGSYTVETDTWYTDQTCLVPFDKTTEINEPVTLYKKWYQVSDGFMISADGRVLYQFTGEQTEVKIPSTVTIIAAEAFSDMKNIEKITLPAGIADIKENAFSGAVGLGRTVSIYATVDGTVNSMLEGQKLANKYDCFEYVSASGTGTGSGSETGNPTISTDDIHCGLSDVNLGIDDNTSFVYPKITLPIGDLQPGSYEMTFTNVNEPDKTKLYQLLQAAGYNMDSNYVYFMDITMKKKGDVSGNKPDWSTGTMTIKMPLPVSWYGRDHAKIMMFTVNKAGTALDYVDIPDISNNIFTFNPPHFSEFALVFTGSLPSTGGSSSGGSSSGGSSSGGSGSEGSSSGGSSSGGSSSSGSSSGSSSSGSSSGGSSSAGNTSASTGTAASMVTTPTITPSDISLVTPAPEPGTQTAITTGSVSGGSAGGTTAHVKDSTPKTGDPLEYRSILVCSFFSIGVLLLLIGNKKRTSSSSQSLRA